MIVDVPDDGYDMTKVHEFDVLDAPSAFCKTVCDNIARSDLLKLLADRERALVDAVTAEKRRG